jgi:hypothetical protein
MGMRTSRNEEETEDNLEFNTNYKYKLDSDKKDTLVFPSTKNIEIGEDKTYNTNISITEELNKSTKMDSTYDNKNELVPFNFKWKEKENNNKELEVMIAGTFLNNWETFIKMEKNPETNIYEYQTFLPKEKHSFKYIINNKWQCNDLYPTTKDNSNNINNYIDLTNYNNNENKENKILIKKVKTKKKKRKENKEINDGYGLKFPLIKDLNSKAPDVMLHYKDLILIDNQSNQDRFDNKKFFNYKKKKFYNENNSYKDIFIFPHEKLEHLSPNIDDIFSTKNYNRYSITERKKHKYITLVYYKPK